MATLQYMIESQVLYKRGKLYTGAPLGRRRARGRQGLVDLLARLQQL